MMDSIRTVTYSILVNGLPTTTIFPSSGIRQGNPLSPYIFILCLEGLSMLMHMAELAEDFKGMVVAYKAPSVSHLFLQTIACSLKLVWNMLLKL